MHKLLQGAMRNFLGWCKFFGGCQERDTAPPSMTDRKAAIFYAFFFFPGGGRECAGWLQAEPADRIQSGSSTNPNPPRSTVGSGQRGRRLCVLLGCRVWSKGNGQKGRKSLACGMAQNELLPSFCSSASQWERSLEGQITRAQNHKLQQNEGGKNCQRREKKVKKRSDIMLFVNIWLDIWWGHTVERWGGVGGFSFTSYPTFHFSYLGRRNVAWLCFSSGVFATLSQTRVIKSFL